MLTSSGDQNTIGLGLKRRCQLFSTKFHCSGASPKNEKCSISFVLRQVVAHRPTTSAMFLFFLFLPLICRYAPLKFLWSAKNSIFHCVRSTPHHKLQFLPRNMCDTAIDAHCNGLSNSVQEYIGQPQ